MTKEKKHNEQQDYLSEEINDMISGAYIDWGKRKEQIWPELEKKMGDTKTIGTKIIFRPGIKLAVAAVLLILIGIPVFFQLYTKTVYIPPGKQSSIYLPDASKVKINAQSTLTYKPLLWKFSRQIKFEGEAYFEVQPGEKFEVFSSMGKTNVLGTTFNIYSRDNDYQVVCVSGKVKVTENKNNKEVILNPGQKAALNKRGILYIQSDINTGQSLSWLNNKFSFTSIPLPKVFEEISRQYGIKITVSGSIDYIYTGTFNKSNSVENVLNLVCRPFDLRFTKKSGSEFIILKNN